jgi:hypothetical protein
MSPHGFLAITHVAIVVQKPVAHWRSIHSSLGRRQHYVGLAGQTPTIGATFEVTSLRIGAEMGNRANFVVVKDRDWRLYYSHWAGCESSTR